MTVTTRIVGLAFAHCARNAHRSSGTPIEVTVVVARGQLPYTVSDGRRWVRRDLLELVERAHAAQRVRQP